MMLNLYTGGNVYVDASKEDVRWVHNFYRFPYDSTGQYAVIALEISQLAVVETLIC